ncbi:MAG: Hsp70 family protein [Acidobacteriota bacterium]
MSAENHHESPRYVVGIDLGTTNSAACFVDTEAEPWTIETFLIHQLTAPSTVERRETLPSFHYEPLAADAEGGALRLPWERDGGKPAGHWVGTLARDRGAEVPGRLVASAKSWLSHSGVDRTAALLPWHGAPEVRKVSPMTVSARYLEHLRQAWDFSHPEHPLAEQDVMLTVPASFDEIARELTVSAAKEAGLPRVVLIEEPQAAFYAWISRRAESAEAPLEAGQNVLVLDVGGGTTDLTLIRVEGETGGELRFRRVAVGEHLILGGDNLDLALAQHLEAQLGSGKLDRRQWSVLIHRARQAKETLLGQQPPESLTITLPGGGSKLLGGALRVEVRRQEVMGLLVEGFLPQVALGDRPAPRASGFRELGLPYAPDSAITRYLATFLREHSLGEHGLASHGEATAVVRPDVVLFNGGFFAGKVLRDRVLEILGSWFDEGDWAPRVLRSERLDLAVAQGAAYFGMVRRGEGERIQGGLAHAYYIGARHGEGAEDDGSPPSAAALCLVPAGLEEGHEVTLEDRAFELLIRQPVEFPIYTSSTRSGDRPGDLIEVDPEQLRALPPIRTVLRSGKKKGAEVVKVRVHARLTEIGTLAVWCSEAAGQRSWRLEFDVRSAVRTDAEAHHGLGEAAGIVPQETVDGCVELIEETFGRSGKSARPDALAKRLEEVVGQGRWDWPPSLLRAVWRALIDRESGRGLSIAHEARWLNLLGFALRPGFGVAVDDWRMARTWQLSHRKLVHTRNAMCRGEWWVLWRRLSGGLTAGQQRALAQPVLAELKSVSEAKWRRRPHEAAEVRRLLASLEWLEPQVKTTLGEQSVRAIERHGAKDLSGAQHFALARLGARVPAYGPPNGVVDVETVEAWLRRVMAIEADRGHLRFAVMQLARRTGDRFRDISSDLRQQAIEWLEATGSPAHYALLVREGGELETGEEQLVFGDSLPKGLMIR